jgi:hypothetical protein
MIATIVNRMKLVMNIEWNSFASCSVKPDKDPARLSSTAILSSPFEFLLVVTAHVRAAGVTAWVSGGPFVRRTSPDEMLA